MHQSALMKYARLDERSSAEIHLMVSSILAVVVMSGFTGYRVFLQHYLQAAFNASFVLVGAAMFWWVANYRKTLVPGCCLSGVFVLGLPIACFFWGPQHATWAFPGLLSPIFFLPPRLAVAFISVGYAVLVPVLWIQLPMSSFGPLIAALFANLIFALSILRNNIANTGYLKQQSLVDALTGIGNRRAMLQAFEHYVSSGYCNEYCLVVLDLDKFKSINDRYGHTMGDKALQHVSMIIATHLPTDAKLFRYGGEEFVAFVHGDCYSVKQQLDTVLDTLKASSFDYRIALSFSAGVATFNSETLEGWISRADAALLHAKRDGRSRVYIGH